MARATSGGHVWRSAGLVMPLRHHRGRYGTRWRLGCRRACRWRWRRRRGCSRARRRRRWCRGRSRVRRWRWRRRCSRARARRRRRGLRRRPTGRQLLGRVRGRWPARPCTTRWQRGCCGRGSGGRCRGLTVSRSGRSRARGVGGQRRKGGEEGLRSADAGTCGSGRIHAAAVDAAGIAAAIAIAIADAVAVAVAVAVVLGCRCGCSGCTASCARGCTASCTRSCTVCCGRRSPIPPQWGRGRCRRTRAIPCGRTGAPVFLGLQTGDTGRWRWRRWAPHRRLAARATGAGSAPELRWRRRRRRRRRLRRRWQRTIRCRVAAGRVGLIRRIQHPGREHRCRLLHQQVQACGDGRLIAGSEVGAHQPPALLRHGLALLLVAVARQRSFSHALGLIQGHGGVTVEHLHRQAMTLNGVQQDQGGARIPSAARARQRDAAGERRVRIAGPPSRRAVCLCLRLMPACRLIQLRHLRQHFRGDAVRSS